MLKISEAPGESTVSRRLFLMEMKGLRSRPLSDSLCGPVPERPQSEFQKNKVVVKQCLLEYLKIAFNIERILPSSYVHVILFSNNYKNGLPKAATAPVKFKGTTACHFFNPFIKKNYEAKEKFIRN